MRVAVSVHGRFHGFDLARELQVRGHLAGLITTYPKFAVRRHLAMPGRLATAPWLELRRRVCQKFGGLCGDLDGDLASAFGRYAAAHLPPGLDLLVGWSGATLEAIDVAHRRGARVVLERGSSHIEHQTQVLGEVYARHGQDFSATSPRIIERELAEYQAADAIAVPSTFAAETFTRHGVPADKLLINPYGVDLQAFAPPPRRDHARPRIVFVGRVGLRKGVPELLEAFAPLAGAAELHVIGPREPGCPAITGPNVFERGPLPMAALPAAYDAADIFCLPSWEEGFPLVLLQAMAAGLPVVATEPTGAADIVVPGESGMIVAAGDIAALGAALESLVSAPERRQAYGEAARARVADGYGWQDYGARAVGHYRRLLSAY